MSTSTAKTSAKRSSAKKKHDSGYGLSRSDRELVHSLRRLLDPKGKGKADGSNSEDFVNPLKDAKRGSNASGQVPARRPRDPKKKPFSPQHEKKVVIRRDVGETTVQHTVVYPPGVGKRGKSKVESAARGRASDALMRSKKVLVETRHIPPSKVRRAERRKLAELVRRDTPLPGRGPMSKIGLTLNQKDEMKVLSAKFASIIPKKDVGELDVVTAFGGAGCLDLLCKKVEMIESHLVWVPHDLATSGRYLKKGDAERWVKHPKGIVSVMNNDVRSSDFGQDVRAVFSNVPIKRQYSKAVSGLDKNQVVGVKNRLRSFGRSSSAKKEKVKVLPSEKKVDVGLSQAEEVTKASVEKPNRRKVTPSKARRIARRASVFSGVPTQELSESSIEQIQLQAVLTMPVSEFAEKLAAYETGNPNLDKMLKAFNKNVGKNLLKYGLDFTMQQCLRGNSGDG